MTTLGEVFSKERDHWQDHSVKMYQNAYAYEILCSGTAMFTLLMPLMTLVFTVAPIKMKSEIQLSLTIGPWVAAIFSSLGLQSLDALMHNFQNLGEDSKK